VPIEVRQILALAAGVPGDFDLDLLRALGERIATRPILPVHFSQALTSGLVERVLDAPGLVIRFRGDDDGDAGARAIALRWLDPPRAEALLQALTDHLDDGAADALGIPYALLLSLRGKEVVDGVAPRTAPGAATALRGLVRLTRRRVERVERWLERVGAPRVATPQSSAGPPPPVEPPQASDQDASTAPVEPDSPDIDDDTKASELLAGEVSTPPTSGGESEATEELERTDAANDPDGVESAEHVQTIDVSVTVDLPWIPEFDDEPEEDSAAAPPPVTKPHLIFVSYARNDKELVDELLDHLRPLAAERGVEVWAGDEIEGGDRWQTQIQAKLDQACLMVACVTPRFLHSMWCREESRYAREAGTVILPVHVSRFSARNDLFADLQFVPDLSRAVAEWGERPWQRDTAWSMVVDAVHVLLDRVDAERAEAAEANAQAVGAERERAAKARAVGAEREQAATAAARAEAEARERPPADAKSSSWATPAGPWDGPNPHLVPPLLTIVPGTHFQGQPGTFLMGSPKGVGYGDERPQRLITLTRTYALGEAPVTQAQWRAVVEAAQAAPWAKDEPEAAKLNPTPSHFEKGPDAAQRPVENISWHDAVAWCNALSRLTGRPPAYRRDGDTWARDPDSAGFRLPTEADWEHACRAGTTTRWSFGDDEARSGEFAWLDANANNTTHPVKAKQPNPWGLHDVHGNVYEWCEDGWSDTYDAKATVDPRVDRGGTRVVRGGGFGGAADGCRSAYRNHGRPGSPPTGAGASASRCRRPRAALDSRSTSDAI
jgi:formylglycine-generating enzyme required for sulfatase activity